MKNPVHRFLFLIAAWGVLTAGAGHFKLLAGLPAPVLLLLIGGLTTAFAVAATRIAWINEAICAIGVRRFLAAHGVRLVGAYFLWLGAQGRLPLEFAQRAGWGDITAAVGALLLLLLPDGPFFRRALLVWNVFGALDLVVAVGTAGWLSTIRPGSMDGMAGFPLAMIPLWVVPILLSSHLAIFRRYWRLESAGVTRARA